MGAKRSSGADVGSLAWGRFEVDDTNFGQVVNLRAYLTDTAPGGKYNPVDATQTASNIAGIYDFQVYATLAGASADFSFTGTPTSWTGFAGSSATMNTTAVALNGFTGNITFSATGLPPGGSASFSPNPLSGSGNATATISTSCTTPPGNYTVNVKATSGALQHSISTNLTVQAVTNLCGIYNRIGVATDGTKFSGGFDNGGHAYSANLLGQTVNFGGIAYAIGPPNAPSAVSSR